MSQGKCETELIIIGNPLDKLCLNNQNY